MKVWGRNHGLLNQTSQEWWRNILDCLGHLEGNKTSLSCGKLIEIGMTLELAWHYDVTVLQVSILHAISFKLIAVDTSRVKTRQFFNQSVCGEVNRLTEANSLPAGTQTGSVSQLVASHPTAVILVALQLPSITAPFHLRRRLKNAPHDTIIVKAATTTKWG